MDDILCGKSTGDCQYIKGLDHCGFWGTCPNQMQDVSIKGVAPDAPAATRESTRKNILETAIQCVCTDREQQYGSPEDNFHVVSELWTAYMGNNKGRWNIIFTAHDVAMMMCLLKIGRIASGQAKADNYIDLAGYAACAGEIALKEADCCGR